MKLWSCSTLSTISLGIGCPSGKFLQKFETEFSDDMIDAASSSPVLLLSPVFTAWLILTPFDCPPWAVLSWSIRASIGICSPILAPFSAGLPSPGVLSRCRFRRFGDRFSLLLVFSGIFRVDMYAFMHEIGFYDVFTLHLF